MSAQTPIERAGEAINVAAHEPRDDARHMQMPDIARVYASAAFESIDLQPLRDVIFGAAPDSMTRRDAISVADAVKAHLLTEETET